MNKIKWLFGVCLVALLVCFNCLDVRADETEIDTSVFEYEENDDGTIRISEYNGTDETITIPAEIDGKSVKSIGGRAFNLCNTVKHLIIQEGITDIRSNAFRECENLETVSFPSTLKTIDYGAFFLCDKLSNVNLPDGLISIGDYAFAWCSSIEKLIIPDSVLQIGEGAFNLGYDDRIPIYGNPNSYAKKYADEDRIIKFSCINHSNIVTDNEIPATCTKDGQTAGSHCSDCGTIFVRPQTIPKGHKIVNVYIPPTCTKAGDSYTYCEVCKEKDVSESGVGMGTSFYPPLGHKFDGGIIKSGEKIYTCKVCGKTKKGRVIAPKKGTVVLSDTNVSYKIIKSRTKNGTVEYIGMKSSKTNITIPNTVTIDGIIYKVTSISKNAFKNNKKVKKITIGSNITSINANAFSGCKKLKTITVKSKNIKSIGKNAFKGINAKAKIKVPSSKLTKYKKLFAGKGQMSTVKIK